MRLAIVCLVVKCPSLLHVSGIQTLRADYTWPLATSAKDLPDIKGTSVYYSLTNPKSKATATHEWPV